MANSAASSQNGRLVCAIGDLAEVTGIQGGTVGEGEQAQVRSSPLPAVLAGPLLRRVQDCSLALWLVTSRPLQWQLSLGCGDRRLLQRSLERHEARQLPLGRHAWLVLIHVQLDEPLPAGQLIDYDLGFPDDSKAAKLSWIRDWAPHLCYPGRSCPNFVFKRQLDRLFHGSCRRPHHPAPDGLLRVDRELESSPEPEQRPTLLMLSGDQVYCDDVAGPMLRAIHHLIDLLGLHEETLEGAVVHNSRELRSHPSNYYHRERLLPASESSEALVERFLGGVRKPVFTTANAQNHLITLAEVMAMYLLVWSPTGWTQVNLEPPPLEAELEQRYRAERACLTEFVEGLPRAARALAHLPTYMIFDDHDVTDDWNLSALWESTAYEHPFSRRIVGNALIGYLLGQGWGNCPDRFDEELNALQDWLDSAIADTRLDAAEQNRLIDRLLDFQNWHYQIDTSIPVLVLDTRTRRWRSELARSRPSGLMDWEALTEFQHAIMGRPAVVVVSAAPMFGVKLIEAIQRVFTWLGRPLVVDAENWMAHRGAASVLFNIFAHSRTPENFVILSGDVHYSFVYDVRLRHRGDSPRIWQITSSGIKNRFPEGLLEWLDRANRWLYSPRSPLNWFTKRRRMRVTPRLPTGRDAGERLWNEAGIGLVELNAKGVPVEIRQLNASGGGTRFLRSDQPEH